MDYNATKGGVDTVDKMCETCNCARGTNRWPMVFWPRGVGFKRFNFKRYHEYNKRTENMNSDFL